MFSARQIHRLLKEWLSPEQLAQFEKRGSFDVIGSAGRRYRITMAHSYNIGRYIGGRWWGVLGEKYCFVPKGDLSHGRRDARAEDRT